MTSRIYRKLNRLRNHARIMGTSAALRCAHDELRKREVVRRLPINGTEVYLRTNSPDLNVAISSLYREEYAGIRCRDPKVILDIGANIGTSALYFAQRYPGARIIAVEPEDSNFALLEMNTRHLPNVTALKAAVWGTTEKRVIKNRHTGHWGYTVSDTSGGADSTGQEIDCLTMRDLMTHYGIEVIDLLKMDIEGGEKSVLEHASEWIDAVQVMTVELHDRICVGCDRAFYLATRAFAAFEKHGEKVTAYRTPPLDRPEAARVRMAEPRPEAPVLEPVWLQ